MRFELSCVQSTLFINIFVSCFFNDFVSITRGSLKLTFWFCLLGLLGNYPNDVAGNREKKTNSLITLTKV